MALEQEKSAAKIGVASDKFRQVFESFTQTGGIKAVQEIGETTEETLTKATRTTSLLIAALSAVGVGTKNVNRQTTEIGKLLEGEVKQRDRIRIASGLTVAELNKQSLEAQKTGRFLQFVEISAESCGHDSKIPHHRTAQQPYPCKDRNIRYAFAPSRYPASDICHQKAEEYGYR